LNICGSRIKQRREELKMTQAELAAAINVDFKIKVDRSDISEIERGVRGLKDYELFSMAKILNVSPVWLLCGEE
jgi:transcriptional regulator with XRE-family HTH domain